MKDIINVFTADHSLSQKMNYLKSVLSRRQEILNYDPLTISIVATSRCTLNCDMCPTHSRLIPKDYPHLQDETRDITFETFKEVVDKFHNALNVHIIGSGEPLLNKDFFKMVEYGALKKMKVKTFSNGTTIGDNIERIVKSPLAGITISLNGHSEDEFSRMTGCPGHLYRKIQDAAGKLIRARNESGSRVKINFSFIIDKTNYRDIASMIETGLRLGADFIFLCTFLPAPYDGFRPEERMIFTDDEAALSWLKELRASLGQKISRRVSFPAAIDRDAGMNRCPTHFTQIRVDGEGRISSCSIMLLNMSGHGRFSDEDVWNNGFFRDMRRKFIANDKNLLADPCRVCPENCGVDLDA